MPRVLARAKSEDVHTSAVAPGGITAPPFTASVWVKFQDANHTISQTVWSLAKATNNGDQYQMFVVLNTVDARFSAVLSGSGSASSTTDIVNDVWNHFLWTEVSGGIDREIFQNGVSEGTNSTDKVISSLDRLSYGARRDTGVDLFAGCHLFWGPMWNVVLSANDVLMLAKGADPRTIRRDALKWFPRFVFDEDRDIIGHQALTAVSTAYTIDAAGTGATHSGSTVTLTVTGGHDIAAGDVVTVAGVDDSDYDGVFTILTADATTMTYTLAAVSDTTSGGGTVTAFLNVNNDRPFQTRLLSPRYRGRGRYRAA